MPTFEGEPETRSTFGLVDRIDDVTEIARIFDSIGCLVDNDGFDEAVNSFAERTQRDAAIVAAWGRWKSDAFLGREYVPGDVVGLRMRSAAVAQLGAMQAVLVKDRTPPGEAADALWLSAVVLMSTATTFYRSVPYFLPVTSALGILGSAVPEDTYLEDLRLPFDAVTVYFGADLEIPSQLLLLRAALFGDPSAELRGGGTARVGGDAFLPFDLALLVLMDQRVAVVGEPSS